MCVLPRFRRWKMWDLSLGTFLISSFRAFWCSWSYQLSPWSIGKCVGFGARELHLPGSKVFKVLIFIVDMNPIMRYFYRKYFYNKLASVVDAIAISKIWKHYTLTFWPGARRCYCIYKGCCAKDSALNVSNHSNRESLNRDATPYKLQHTANFMSL